AATTRLRAPPGRGAAAHVLAPRRARARPRANDRLPRWIGLDGGREGDLVEGRRAHAPRDRAAPAPALPLHVLLVRRHAALHARSEPARAARSAGGPRARRRRVLPRRRHGFRDAAVGSARMPRRGALPPRGRRARHRRRRGRHLRPSLMAGALAGLRILDLADQTGALAGKLLADLGADVVLVEPPGGGRLRGIPPFWRGLPHPERSLFFWFYNTSKRGITLDVARPAGAALLRRLAADADVL